LDTAQAPLSVIFAGTPDFALPPLKALIDEGCRVEAVLTQPDRPAGRGRKLQSSPVKLLAIEHGLEVLQPATLKDEQTREALTGLAPDLVVVVAYGLMIPDWLLDLPPLGCWNIHASLLPRWRGAAPIQRAIEAGDEQTGVSIMQIEKTLDTGPVYHTLTTPIKPKDTAATLHDRLAEQGARALTTCLQRALAGELGAPVPQAHEQATYARKLSKAEAELDWNEPAGVLQRRVRAFNPWPVAWCELGGQRLRVWQAQVAEGPAGCQPGQVVAGPRSLLVGTAEKCLALLEVQRAGGKPVPIEQFLNSSDVAAW
jgi:methionyl-tRNA formyltransferase